MDAPKSADNRHRNSLLGAALDEWEAEDGPFTESELAAATAASAQPDMRRSLATSLAEAAAELIDTDNDFLRGLDQADDQDDHEDGE